MRMMMFLIALAYAVPGFAQPQDKEIAKGNRQFKNESYAEAEASYRISHSRSQSGASAYNLGNAIYRLEKPSEAKTAYAHAIKNAKTRAEKHQAYHNMGNVLMKEKDYQSAVQAYKNALINNPSDDQTRYNYALAKKMLKENPPQNNNNQDKNQDGDKDDENKDDSQPKDKEQGKNNEQDQKNQPDPKDPKDEKQPASQPQPRPGGISKERMENLLDAVNNEEKKVQDKVKATQEKGRPVRNEKDW